MNKDFINEFNKIYDICKDITRNRKRSEINILFIEELSELTKALTKLERWLGCDKTLRNNYSEIVDNIYEELADVIIMILQFTIKKHISYKDLLPNQQSLVGRI